MCYVHGTALEAFRMGSEKKKKKDTVPVKKGAYNPVGKNNAHTFQN